MCKLSDQCVSFPVLFCFVNSQGFAIRTLASHINCSLLTFCSYNKNSVLPSASITLTWPTNRIIEGSGLSKPLYGFS